MGGLGQTHCAGSAEALQLSYFSAIVASWLASVIPALAKGAYLADLIAIIGSMDLVMGEVDR